MMLPQEFKCPRLKQVLACLAPFFIICAFFIYGNNPGDCNGILPFITEYFKSDRPFVFLILYIGSILVFKRIIDNLRVVTPILALSVCIGIVFTFGRSYCLFDDARLIFSNLGLLLTSIIAFIGYTVFFYVCIYYFDTCCVKGRILCSTSNDSKCQKGFFGKHEVLRASVLLMLLWLPYLIAFAPGVIHTDAYVQLEMFYGIVQWTTHFPVFSTWIMGNIMSLGKFIFSDETGVLIYVVIQYVLFAFTLGYGFRFFKNWNIPNGVRWLTVLFLGIVPIFPMYSIMEIKDTLFYIVFLWVVYFSIEHDGATKSQPGMLVMESILYALLCLTRNEGKYILACYFVFLILRRRKFDLWKQKCASLLVGVLAFVLINNAMIGFFGVGKGSIGEALSLPFQQTARYMKYHRDDLTKEEKEVIDHTFNHADIGSIYEPNRSDAVKSKLHKDISTKELMDYLFVWMKLGIRHPGTYISATFNSTYGYYYPEKEEFYKLGFSGRSPGKGDSLYTDDIEIQQPSITDPVRKLMLQWMNVFKENAFVGWISHPGFYGLILLLILFESRYNRLRFAGILILPILALFVCFLSPLNSSIRYSLPIVCSLPVIICNFIRGINAMHSAQHDDVVCDHLPPRPENDAII